MNTTLKEIFDKNYSPLCSYAAVIVNDKHFAEDIVQSVFIQLWENEKILTLKDPQPYLLKCVKFKCLDHIKSSKRKQLIFTDSLPEYTTEENSLKQEDILPLLHYFVDQLPPKMKTVFLMSRQQGMSYREIASELDLSIKTIENQMGTALKKLRVLLQKHHYLSCLVFFFQ